MQKEAKARIKINKLLEDSGWCFYEYQQLNGFKTVVPQYVRDYAYHLTNL